MTIVVDDVFGLIGIIIPVLLLAWLASRLLGIRRSALRSVITGLLGVTLGVLLAAASYQGRLPSTFELAIRVAAFSIISTMGLAIAWEFVASPARRTPRGAARSSPAPSAPGEAHPTHARATAAVPAGPAHRQTSGAAAPALRFGRGPR